MSAWDTLSYSCSYKEENEKFFSPFLSPFAFKNLTAWGEEKKMGGGARRNQYSYKPW